jgi:hypothetical protein
MVNMTFKGHVMSDKEHVVVASLLVSLLTSFLVSLPVSLLSLVNFSVLDLTTQPAPYFSNAALRGSG